MDTETENRPYELEYLLKGDFDEEKVEESAENLRESIEKEQGIISHETKPQKQNLGYSVKKYDTAYFGSLKFILSPEKLQTLRKSLEKFNLLRFLLVGAKQKKETGTEYPFKKRMRITKKFPLQAEGRGIMKKSALPLNSQSVPLKREEPVERQSEPLQVEDIDKKLEELLGQ